MTSRQTTVAARNQAQNIEHAVAAQVASASAGTIASASLFSRPPPVIDTVQDGYGAIKGPIENGGYTDDSRPTISGKGEPGVRVNVYDGNAIIGWADVLANGDWFLKPTLPLKGGKHELSVTHQYPSGELVVGTEVRVIFIDKVAPDMPVVVGIEDDQGRITDPITNGSVTDDNKPTIQGKSEAFAKIVIYDKDVPIDTVDADEKGNWRYTPQTALDDGLHILNFVAVDRAGNTSEDTRKIEFTVDTRDEKINIFGVEDDVGGWQGTVMSGGRTDDTKPMFFGSATAGGIVKVYEGGVLVGWTTAGVDGTWELTPTVALSNGAHTFQATVTLPAKGESDRSKPFSLTVATTPPMPTIDEVWDNEGSSTGALKAGDTTDDNTPTLRGKAEAGTTVRIYTVLGSAFPLASVVADANGNWEFTPSTPLADQTYYFRVRADNLATGGMSEVSAPFTVVVNTIPKVVATVTDIGKDSGVDAHDFLTNDGRAGRLMQGKLSAALNTHEKLQVSTDGGKTWKEALVTGSTWSAQDDSSHAAGWTIQTRVVNGSGIAGALTTQAVALDTVAPEAPTKLTISGSQVTVFFAKQNVEVGDRLYLVNGNQNFVYELTAADVAAGRVTSVPGITLSDSLTAAIVDRAGNQSPNLSTRTVQFFEDFSGSSGNEIAVGKTVEYAHFTLKNISGVPIIDASGAGVIANPTKGLWIGYSMFPETAPNVVELDLKVLSTSVSFRYGGTDAKYPNDVSFLDENGALLGTTRLEVVLNTWAFASFTAPEGKMIARIVFDIEILSNGVIIDDVTLDAAVNTFNSSQPVNQNVTGLHLGGDASTVFSLAATSNLSAEHAGVHGGKGTDTLKLTGVGQALDLTALAGKVSSIEILDITGTGNNTLTLNLANVLDNGAANAFYVGDKARVQMMVKGNAGDKVNLSDLLASGADYGDWAKKAAVVIGGVTYDSYQHSSLGAELLVQQGVTVTLDNHALVNSTSTPDTPPYYYVLGDEVPEGGETQSYSVDDDLFIAKLGFVDRLAGGHGNDTFLNIGTGDVVIGGKGDDTVHVMSGDFALLKGNEGIDTLVMDGKAMHIDLSAMGLQFSTMTPKVQGFEKFDLGAGGNTLSLSAEDVLAGGARDMVTADGKVQMLVNGADGEVNLRGGSDDWTSGGSTTVGGVTYEVYTNLAGTAELLVEDKVHVTIL